MTAKELFDDIRGSMRFIFDKCDQRAELRALAEKVTPSMSAAPSGSGDGRKLENVVERIVEYDAEIEAELTDFFRKKDLAHEILCQMPDKKLRYVLEARYFSLKTYEKIAADIGYSYFGLRKMHARALREADKIMETMDFQGFFETVDKS